MKNPYTTHPPTKLRRFRARLGVAALALLLATLPSLVRAVHAQSTPKSLPDTLIPASQRKPAPGFTLTDAQGQPVSLGAYRGKVVLLDFWATWCGGCKLEIPWYIAFYHQYRDRGLAPIGASMDDDGWKSVRPFLARKKDPETRRYRDAVSSSHRHASHGEGIQHHIHAGHAPHRSPGKNRCFTHRRRRPKQL